jgi:thioredoxin-like negative regulator of GroEL
MNAPRRGSIWAVGLMLGALALMGNSPPPAGPDAPRHGEGKRGPGGGRGPRAMGKGEGPKGGGGGGGGKGAAEGGAAAGKDGKQRPPLGAGNMFLKKGGNKAAAGAFRKQLDKNPDAAAAHVGLGKALTRMGRCEEALLHLWPYVGTLPFGGDAALAASTCSGRIGLLGDAVYFDHLAVELSPESARALTSLALDTAAIGDTAASADALEELLFLRKDRDASAYARANLALRDGDIEAFDEVAALWERDDGAGADLRRLQAQSWLDMDNPRECEAILARLASLRSGNQTRYLRAEAHRRMGYANEAVEFLADRPQSVLEGVDPDSIRVRVAVDRGEYAQAHELLAAYEGLPDPEILASRWYLARAEGRTDALPALEAEYRAVRMSPLRELEHLVPVTLRGR